MRIMQTYIQKNKEIFVGLEDSKRSWVICVRSEKTVVHETSMPAKYEVLLNYLNNNYPGCTIQIMYEAGFRGFILYDRLTAVGFTCFVIPPNKVTEEKDQRHKNDRTDCRRLALNLENGDFKSCYVPDKERREDRQISRLLVQVQKDIIMVRNRIRKFLEFHGLDQELPPGRWRKSDYEALHQLDLADSLDFCLKRLLQRLDQLLQDKQDIIRKLKQISQKSRYRKLTKLFQSAPGIGWFTAIRLVLEWGEDLSRFPDGKSFGSYVGLVCTEHSTGERVRFGHITRQSASFIRGWLIENAWTAYRRDPVLLKKFQDVWQSSGSKKKAIVAVARKLAVRLYHCAVTGEPWVIGVAE
jgi:transposase